ncbi:pentapeptide repeat-containing protein [Streptomyces paradoxus]|uniref:pentapeptide repeat-containing protein n=1 Tax=Streptomyces paradoxus TaxID=66375 RepID=UPI0037CD9CF8
MLGVLLSTIVAAVGIGYSNIQVREQLKISSQELGIAQEGQITDRYTKAVENLGDDAMDIRLGGIYALQRIMEDSSRDHPTIADVLATFVRTHASKPPKEGEDLRADLRAAMKVLAYRDRSRDDTFFLDLRGTRLPGLELQPRLRNSTVLPLRADLSGADLSGADLSGADLSGADLSGADLSGADLSGADLTAADLTKAGLKGTDLSEATLDSADVSEAYLSGADLTGAKLRHADLTQADLTDADLSGANLNSADLHFVRLEGSDLKGADLTNVTVSHTDLILADLYTDTKLPSHLSGDPDVKARIARVEDEESQQLP